MRRIRIPILIYSVLLALNLVFILTSCEGFPNPGESPLVALPAGDVTQAGNVPTLLDAVRLLAAGATGGIIAFLFERMKWFDKMSSNAKWWVTFGLMVGLPVLAQAAITYVPTHVWAALQPFWNSLALGFVTWLGSQLTHKADRLVSAAVILLKKLSND